jgi:transcription elongation factor GreA
MQRFKITKEGYEKIKNELNFLINVERPNISKAIGEAIELGDLSENAEYSSAKEKQGIVESKIALLNERLSNADIIDLNSLVNTGIVQFGATVTLVDEDTERKVKYQLVGEFESDIDQNKLSIESPLGKALMDKKIDDEIELRIGSNIKTYLIENIEC